MKAFKTALLIFFLSVSFLSVLQLWQIKPVYATTSFGYSSIGGSEDAGVHNTRFVGSNFTLTETANVSSIHAYMTQSFYETKSKCAIYANDFTNIVNSTEFTRVDAGWFWYNYTFAINPTLSSGSYFLVFWSDKLTTWTQTKYTTGDFATQGIEGSGIYGDFPSTISSYNYTNRKYSVYANYTTASIAVTVTITTPMREYYVSSTVPVEFSASGGTIDKYWYNLKNDTNWVYVSNQTYTTPTTMTGLVNGVLYTLYAYANNTYGDVGVTTVRFNIDLAGYKATSGSIDHIQAKVEVANSAGGGNVYIPSGNFSIMMNSSWIDPVYGRPLGILGYGGVNITGGIGEFPTNTILFSMGGAQPPVSSTMLFVWGTNGKFFRIRGLYFQGWLNANQDDMNTLAISVLDAHYRIDHCNFTDFSSTSISQRQYTQETKGLVDHVNIDNQYRTLNVSAQWAYGIVATAYNENIPWANNTADVRGNFPNASMFVEDSWFNCCRYAFSSNSGAYYTFRHNTVYTIARPTFAAGIDIHQGDTSNDGGRGAEIYNNTFIALGMGFIGESSGFKLRGGMSLIYNNTVTGAFYSSIALIQYLWSQPAPWKNQPRDTWEWDNVYSGQSYRYYQTPSNWADPISDNVWTDTIIMHNNTNYSLLNNYTAYPYPHPWAVDASIPLSWDRISQNATSLTVGSTLSVASYWKYDDTTRSFYYVESNRTGSWTNGTITAFGSGVWGNETLLCSVEGVIGWRVHANDSANVWITFNIQFVTVTAAGSGWSQNLLGVLNIQISMVIGIPKSSISKIDGVP